MSSPRRPLTLAVNLARTPFLSFKLYFALWGLLGVLGGTALLAEGWQIWSLLERRGKGSARVVDATARLDKAQGDLEKLSAYLNPKALEKKASEAREIRDLVERRTFDWNRLLTELEGVLPNNVRLVDLAPQAETGAVGLQIRGVAKGLADQNEMVERMEKSELFDEVFVANQSAAHGEVEFTLRCRYLAAGRPSLPRSPGPPRRVVP